MARTKSYNVTRRDAARDSVLAWEAALERAEDRVDAAELRVLLLTVESDEQTAGMDFLSAALHESTAAVDDANSMLERAVSLRARVEATLADARAKLEDAERAILRDRAERFKRYILPHLDQGVELGHVI